MTSTPPSLTSASALAINGLSVEQGSHVQALLEARGVSPDNVQAYIADLMAIIESGFDSYFAGLGDSLSSTKNLN